MLIVLVKLVAALSGLAASYLMYLAVGQYLAEQAFKRRSPKLPWPVQGSFLTGHANSFMYASRSHENLADAHKKYGKTLAFMYKDQPLVSTIDLDLIKTFTVDEPNEHINRMRLGMFMKEYNHENILFAESDQWRRIRKVYAAAFSARKVKSQDVQEQIQGCIERFIESIEWRLNEAEKNEGQQAAVELDVDDIFLRYALDLIFTCFYRQQNIIDYYAPQDEWAELSSSFPREMISPLWRFSIMFPILNPIISWLALNFHPTGAFRKKLQQYINEQLEFHVKMHREAKDKGQKVDNYTSADGKKFTKHLMDYVTDCLSAGAITYREYLHSTQTLQIAADKTSSDCLSKIVYYLSIYPRAQDKVREEVIREGVESVYLEWVIYESMRMFSPTNIGASRIVTRDIETEAGLIPKGTNVLTPSFIIHKLKEYWGEDAEEFRPERWADAAKFHPAQYLAFGGGKRRCPGEFFAMSEIKSVISQLLQRFTFEHSERTDPSLRHESPVLIFIVFDKPAYVRFKRFKAKVL